MNKALKEDLDKTLKSFEDFMYDFENLQFTVQEHASEEAVKSMQIMKYEVHIMCSRMDQLMRACD